MSEKVSNVKSVCIRAQNRKGGTRPGPRSQATRSQVFREQLNSAVSASNAVLHSLQRRWSVDFCKCQTPPVITVRKNKKEPDPPQRSASLLPLQTSSHSSFKRYSCPSIGIYMSTSSSSTSSSTSSCPSPTSVPTSVIIGPDPLGWKVQPKSRSSSSLVRAKRLSLQIPLPAVPTPSYPDAEPSSQTKPALKPKPFRRHHSESSAFLRSLEKTLPVVTVEQLRAVHLRPLSLSDELDNVFDEPNQGEGRVTTPTSKNPPPVPEKTAMARKIAKLIARSRQRCWPVVADNQNTTTMKPMAKHCHQNMAHNNMCATKMGESGIKISI